MNGKMGCNKREGGEEAHIRNWKEMEGGAQLQS